MLRPMSEAEKNGKPILAKFRDDMKSVRDDLERYGGCWVVIRNTGRNELDDWRLAGPFGVGGFDENWFDGWQALPSIN